MLVMCHMIRQVFYCIPVDFWSSKAKYLAEIAKTIAIITVKIGAKNSMLAYALSDRSSSSLYIFKAHRPENKLIKRKPTIESTTMKLVLIYLLLTFSELISESISMFYCTKSLADLVLSILL